jgi:glycerate-2-kinase
MSPASGSIDINGAHLNHRQHRTLEALFSHPTPHNLHWAEVRHLFEAVGGVTEEHNGHIRISVGESAEMFDPNHGKDLTTEQVVDLRRMLKVSGFDPSAA